MSFFRAYVLLMCAVLVLVACGDGATTTTAPTTTAPPATTTTTPAATTAPQPTVTAATAPTTTTTAAPTTTTTTRPAGAFVQVTVSGGTVEGPSNVDVKVGDPVRIEVTSDVSDEVHVHGYDLFANVAPGTVGEIEFAADIPGIFEVELEGSHLVLFELTVEP